MHALLKIQTRAPVPEKVRLGWFAAFYRDAMSFVRDDDYVAIRDLLASPTGEHASKDLEFRHAIDLLHLRLSAPLRPESPARRA
jgi:hypothetical protein